MLCEPVKDVVLVILDYVHSLYVTGFAKRGLPHTSNLPTVMVHNFTMEKAIDLKFGQ